LAIGSGLYTAGIVMTVISLLTLSLVNRLELKIFPVRQNKFLEIYFHGNKPPMTEIINVLSDYSASIVSTNVRSSKSSKEHSKVVLFINVPKRLDISKMTEDFQKIEEVDTIVLREKIT